MLRALMVAGFATQLAFHLQGCGADEEEESPPKKALLVIDMQNDFMPPTGSLAVTGGDDIIPTINKLTALDDWDLVIFSVDYHPSTHASFASNIEGKNAFETVELNYTASNNLCGKEYVALYGAQAQENCTDAEVETTLMASLWPDHCVQDTPGQKLHADVNVPEGAVIVRKGFTASVDSYGAIQNNLGTPENNVPKLLESAGIQEVYVVGVAFDYCVKFTSLQSVQILKLPTTVIEDATKPVDADDTGPAAKTEMEEAGVKFVNSDMFLPGE